MRNAPGLVGLGGKTYGQRSGVQVFRVVWIVIRRIVRVTLVVLVAISVVVVIIIIIRSRSRSPCWCSRRGSRGRRSTCTCIPHGAVQTGCTSIMLGSIPVDVIAPGLDGCPSSHDQSDEIIPRTQISTLLDSNFPSSLRLRFIYDFLCGEFSRSFCHRPRCEQSRREGISVAIKTLTAVRHRR